MIDSRSFFKCDITEVSQIGPYGQLTFLSNKLNNWCQMMSNMDQRISHIENLIISQVDPESINNRPSTTPETPASIPSNNQVIPNHSVTPSAPATSGPMDLQAEIKRMQEQFGGEISSAISQMKTFISNFAPLTGSPDNSSSSNSNSSQ